LSKLEGVKQVNVDVRNKRAMVTLADKASLSEEAVVKVLSGTRYKVTSFDSMKKDTK
jgi:copper chaperone CopZ